MEEREEAEKRKQEGEGGDNDQMTALCRHSLRAQPMLTHLILQTQPV